jgi:hypothetical protein
MNSKELMIGNYFEVLTKHLNRITAITESEVQLYSESEKIHFTCHIDYLTAIELTDDWLLAFGFEHKKVQNNLGIESQLYDYFEHKKTGFIIYKSKYGYVLNSHINHKFNPNKMFHKTIHGLQNLYFALTGQELI